MRGLLDETLGVLNCMLLSLVFWLCRSHVCTARGLSHFVTDQSLPDAVRALVGHEGRSLAFGGEYARLSPVHL
jgi:hypothetical protein